jgi:SIR2-like domain
MAYEQKSAQYIPILGEDQISISKLSYDNNITTILKIHGDLNHLNKMVITEEEYDSHTNEVVIRGGNFPNCP